MPCSFYSGCNYDTSERDLVLVCSGHTVLFLCLYELGSRNATKTATRNGVSQEMDIDFIIDFIFLNAYTVIRDSSISNICCYLISN